MKKAARRVTGKHALAAALNRLANERAEDRRAHALTQLSLRKLADIGAAIANEIAAASAAQVAELTALRQEIAACFRPDEDGERRVVRRLRDKAAAP